MFFILILFSLLLKQATLPLDTSSKITGNNEHDEEKNNANIHLNVEVVNYNCFSKYHFAFYI